MCLARCRQRCEGHSIERLWAASAVYACRVPCPPVRCAYDLGGRTNPSDRVLLWKTLNQSESDALLSATEIAAMHGVGLRQRCCVRCRLTHGRVHGHGRAHGMVTGRVVWGRAGARVPPTSSRWFPARIPCPAQACPISWSGFLTATIGSLPAPATDAHIPQLVQYPTSDPAKPRQDVHRHLGRGRHGDRDLLPTDMISDICVL